MIDHGLNPFHHVYKLMATENYEENPVETVNYSYAIKVESSFPWENPIPPFPLPNFLSKYVDCVNSHCLLYLNPPHYWQKKKRKENHVYYGQLQFYLGHKQMEKEE